MHVIGIRAEDRRGHAAPGDGLHCGRRRRPPGPRHRPPLDWTNANVHWVTQPRTAAGRFVAYLDRNGRLAVAGVDAATGRVDWEVGASASFLTPGVAIALAHDDSRVYFAVPADPRRVSPNVLVVAVDAASGTEV